MRLGAIWAPPLLYMALIFALSSQSQLAVPGGLPDVAFHVPEFAILGALLCHALSRTWRMAAATAAGMAALAASIYGILDELHQSVVPGRDASVHDAVADAVGALLGATLVVLLPRLVRAAKGS